MDDIMMRMAELSYQGYYCSQILIILGLEAQGKTTPDLVRAATGLAHGCRIANGTCGTLTGAACLLALYAGKGADNEEQDDALVFMLKDLGEWFTETYGTRFGGVSCEAIVGDGTQTPPCQTIVAETYLKVVEILTAEGYDMTVGK